jgi:hypothetical protein
MNNNTEFYVGYQPKAQRSLARFIAPVAAAVVITGMSVSALLTAHQPPFAASRFEFGVERDYAGTIENWPAPMLVTHDARYLLVAEGKHGLTAAEHLENKPVKLRGSLIQRGSDRMLEVVAGSTKATGAPVLQEGDQIVDLGPVKFTGEIVDSKCYLGVMNPGEGKVHRDCAARCISGGIPPAFVVRDSSGAARTLLLTGAHGRALNHDVLPYVAEPVEISGELVRSGSTLVLRTNLSHIRRR